jgi:saccharopine dehydrogenase-like NADP-dependent oxidoreductase
MQSILVLGAGQSSPCLIRYLLDQAEERDWFVTVADRDVALAEQRVAQHPRGIAMASDMTDMQLLGSQIEDADLVVGLMPPRFQPVIARECVRAGKHLVTASYRDESMRELDADARRMGVLLLPEMGLDPGFDLMSAMRIIERVHGDGGVIGSFESYGGGVLGPDSRANPLRYGITWNPRNVVMAGEAGASFRDAGRIKIIPWHSVFSRTWPIEVPGVGPMEAYANRDSLAYQQTLGLDEAGTMVRGTLRYPGWAELWHQLVRLGLPNEHLRVPDLPERHWRDVTEMFLPRGASGTSVAERVADYLGISRTGGIITKMRWLGLFDREPVGGEGTTIAEALASLLRRKLELPETEPDLVILQHQVIARYPDQGDRLERIVATFTRYGEPGGETAMAIGVGMPLVLGVRMVLEGRIPLRGSHLPTHPMIYGPVLDELEREGLRFEEVVGEPTEDDLAELEA